MTKKLKSDIPTGNRRRIKGKQAPGKSTKPKKKPAQAQPTLPVQPADALPEHVNDLSPPATVTPDPSPSRCSQQTQSSSSSSSSSSSTSSSSSSVYECSSSLKTGAGPGNAISEPEEGEASDAPSQKHAQSPKPEQPVQDLTQIGLEASQPDKQQSTKEDMTDPWMV